MKTETLTPTVAELASALIAQFEGCRLAAYKDSGGVWTIGMGHTGPEVCEGLTITQDQAAELFRKDQAPLLKMVEGKPLIEAAALVSFGFNCGAGALQKVMHGGSLLTDYNHDRRGTVLPGLVTRRRLEDMLILAGWALSGGAAK